MNNDYISRIRGHFTPNLELDREQAWVFGVCAGIANRWQQDVTVVRVVTVIVGLFLWKLVIAAYLVAWLVLDDRKVNTTTYPD